MSRLKSIATARKSLRRTPYSVFLTFVANDSVKQAIKTGDYKLLIKKNGSFVEVSDDKAFEQLGESELKITAYGLETTLTVRVVYGFEILTKNMIETEKIKETDKNFLEKVKLNGKYIMRVVDENGYKFAGWINKGQEIKFHIYSENEAQAELNIVVASGVAQDRTNIGSKPTIIASLKANVFFKASFGGSDIAIGDEKLPGFVSQKTSYEEGEEDLGKDSSGRAYDPAATTQWLSVNLGKHNLKKGDNILTLTALRGDFNLLKLGVSFVA